MQHGNPRYHCSTSQAPGSNSSRVLGPPFFAASTLMPGKLSSTRGVRRTLRSSQRRWRRTTTTHAASVESVLATALTTRQRHKAEAPKPESRNLHVFMMRPSPVERRQARATPRTSQRDDNDMGVMYAGNDANTRAPNACAIPFVAPRLSACPEYEPKGLRPCPAGNPCISEGCPKRGALSSEFALRLPLRACLWRGSRLGAAIADPTAC